MARRPRTGSKLEEASGESEVRMVRADVRRLIGATAVAAWLMGQAPAGTNPFAPSSTPPPAAPANPFAPKPAAGDKPNSPAIPPPNSTNPAAPRAEAKPETKKDSPVIELPAKAAADVLIGTKWNVVADPSTRPVVAIAPAPIPVPGSASGDAKRERTRYRVTVPTVPANVVGLGLNEKETDARDVWDLAASNKIGTVKGLALEGSKLMALSPDGALFAAKPQFDDFVVVVNVATGKTSKTIPLNGARLELLTFSSTNRLLLAEDGRILVHSLPDGRREREIKLEGWVIRDGWDISPGGKYLAALFRDSGDRNRVTFIDLTTGEKAGECKLGGGPGDHLGIAFSRDGKKLASIVDTGSGATVSQIDLTIPKRLPDVSISGADLFADEGYQGRMLEWLPDGRYLLVRGRLLLDPQRGEITRTLSVDSASPIVSIGVGLSLAFNGKSLQPLPLGIDVPSVASSPAVAPSPSVAPTAPPTLTVGPALLAADRSISIVRSAEAAPRWDVHLSPTAVTDKPRSQGVTVPGGFVQQVLVAPSKPPIAFVSYAALPLSAETTPDVATWGATFDLTTGTAGPQVNFSFPTQAVSLSLDGKFVATLSPDPSGRLDVWSVADSKHLGGFLPAGGRADRAVPWYAEFIDSAHLLVAVADELALWKFPECQQVYSMKIGSVRPSLSPMRDVVMVSVPNRPRIAVVDVFSGVVKGTIPSSSIIGDRPLAAAFHNRGQSVAVLSGGAGGGELAVADTATGQDTRFRIPVCGSVIQWCGDEHVLIDGTWLVNVPKQAVAWTYQLPTGMHSRDTLGGLHWYITAVSANDKSFTLTGVSLPEDSAKKQITAAAKSSPPVFTPKDLVRVDVPVLGAASTGAIAAIKEAFTKKYEAAGMKVAFDAPIALVVDPGRMGIQRTNVWKVSLLQAGQTTWTAWIVGTPQGALLEANEPTVIDGRFADPPEVRLALAALLNFDPPKFAFAAGATKGVGSSQLTTLGPRPAK